MPVPSLARYEPADDVCLVTTFFNPAGYASKRGTYLEFAGHVRASGLRLVTVECAFGDAPFELPDADGIVRVRARDVLWQKERLLNIALRRLPDACTKVVWIDFDVRFEDPSWAATTSRLLDDHALVQPFETAAWLPRGATRFEGEGRLWTGFGARYAADPGVAAAGDFDGHGHPGFAWGARRGLLERHGLYDACVAGGGDHVVAHAAAGDWTSRCFAWSFGRDTAHYRHFARWAEPFFEDARGRVTFAPGRVLHLWHGDWEDRNYTFRHKELRAFGFDPEGDLRVDESGCWAWASDKPELRAWAAGYFARRREEGRDAAGTADSTG